ncbi:PREDICTED: uncharacterized protein LOC107105091 [Cyprinodon variegatus]|uniref:uncharacterized protein LOC107105091 n=1 Tax=Cyprinodon variegatus TaxID=28743 RepID=UPI000742B173|nr:PREDICTED: uncharacterized protein LOC107105091 [Cyprinodon variegatus]
MMKERAAAVCPTHPVLCCPQSCCRLSNSSCPLLSSELLPSVQLILSSLVLSVPQVEVDSGVESVLLPCTTKEKLPGDVRVEWKRSDRMVHVFNNGSDRPEEQDQAYRTRTRMNEDLLRTGDLSLTLSYPCDLGLRSSYKGNLMIECFGTFTCSVYSSKGVVMMVKQVDLKVKGLMDIQQILTTITGQVTELQQRGSVNEDQADNLLARVCALEKDNAYLKEKVEDLENQSRRSNMRFIGVPEKMEGADMIAFIGQTIQSVLGKENFPVVPPDKVKILRLPREKGNLQIGANEFHIYPDFSPGLIKKRCCVVKVEEGAQSVLLPFKTTPDLPGEARVEWKDSSWWIVHVYQNGSDQPKEQEQLYKDRTRMNEDPLRTGDLSLTLRRPTWRDNGEYRCRVWMEGEKRERLRVKTVNLKVTAGTVQVQPEDTRTRTSSVDPTPLLADESV